jgi:transcriptional regulator with XRE-family HTH domain
MRLMESAMKTVSLKDKISSLPKARQEAIAQRASEVELEIMTIQKLREAQKLTQEAFADRLGITQASVSRLEKRGDMLLSTLNEVVTKLGGELVVTAKFDDMAPVRVDLENGLLHPPRQAAVAIGQGRAVAVGGGKKGTRRSRVEAQTAAITEGIVRKRVALKSMSKAPAPKSRKPSMAPRSHSRRNPVEI